MEKHIWIYFFVFVATALFTSAAAMQRQEATKSPVQRQEATKSPASCQNALKKYNSSCKESCKCVKDYPIPRCVPVCPKLRMPECYYGQKIVVSHQVKASDKPWCSCNRYKCSGEGIIITTAPLKTTVKPGTRNYKTKWSECTNCLMSRSSCVETTAENGQKEETCVQEGKVCNTTLCTKAYCEYEGRKYKPGQKFVPSCRVSCVCQGKNKTQCLPLCRMVFPRSCEDGQRAIPHKTKVSDTPLCYCVTGSTCPTKATTRAPPGTTAKSATCQNALKKYNSTCKKSCKCVKDETIPRCVPLCPKISLPDCYYGQKIVVSHQVKVSEKPWCSCDRYKCSGEDIITTRAPRKTTVKPSTRNYTTKWSECDNCLMSRSYCEETIAENGYREEMCVKEGRVCNTTLCTGAFCEYEGKKYKPGQKFVPSCSVSCVCQGKNKTQCLPLCPMVFPPMCEDGQRVIDHRKKVSDTPLCYCITESTCSTKATTRAPPGTTAKPDIITTRPPMRTTVKPGTRNYTTKWSECKHCQQSRDSCVETIGENEYGYQEKECMEETRVCNTTLCIKGFCEYEGRTYQLGQKFVHSCSRSCECGKKNSTLCFSLCHSFPPRCKDGENPIAYKRKVTDTPLCYCTSYACPASRNTTTAPVTVKPTDITTCSRKYKKLGCYHDSVMEKMELIISFRDGKGGEQLNWGKFAKSVHSLICKCQRKARAKGLNLISIRYWAECWASKIDKQEISKINRRVRAAPAQCVNQRFQQCKDEDKLECVGKQGHGYAYLYNPRGRKQSSQADFERDLIDYISN